MVTKRGIRDLREDKLCLKEPKEVESRKHEPHEVEKSTHVAGNSHSGNKIGSPIRRPRVEKYRRKPQEETDPTKREKMLGNGLEANPRRCLDHLQGFLPLKSRCQPESCLRWETKGHRPHDCMGKQRRDFFANVYPSPNVGHEVDHFILNPRDMFEVHQIKVAEEVLKGKSDKMQGIARRMVQSLGGQRLRSQTDSIVCNSRRGIHIEPGAHKMSHRPVSQPIRSASLSAYAQNTYFPCPSFLHRWSRVSKNIVAPHPMSSAWAVYLTPRVSTFANLGNAMTLHHLDCILQTQYFCLKIFGDKYSS
eukprot:Gb_36793 [translate_table: standard]